MLVASSPHQQNIRDDQQPHVSEIFMNHRLSVIDLTPKVKSIEDPTVISSVRSRIFCTCCTNTWRAITSQPWCPSEKKLARTTALCALALLLWSSAYSMVPSIAGPKGQLFKVAVLGVAAHIAGWLVSLIRLPSLLGMLLMGILLRNVGFVDLHDEFQDVAADLRQMALSIILIRAGMGLDPTALKRLGGMVSRLAIAPSIAEACIIAVMTHFLLGLPWVWGFLLGSVLAAVSPAVVIPCLFNLQDRGYGRSKGIPTLVIAAASFDDIIAISAFGVVFSLIFNTGELVMQIIRGPLGIIFGILGGIVFGIFLRFIPHKDDKRVSMLRTILLLCGGMMFMFGSDAINYEGAGPLGGIVSAFVASNGWNKKGYNGKAAVQDNFLIIWSIFQPILFGLIGSEIDIFVLDGTTVGLGIASLFVALAGRIITSVIVAAGGNLTWKEKLFISIAWFPKATVQAAIGPVALDVAREMGSTEYEEYAHKVLVVAVLGILFTAPAGASLITFLGPRLLKKENTSETQDSERTIENMERNEEAFEIENNRL